jgi:hypothetical protein
VSHCAGLGVADPHFRVTPSLEDPGAPWIRLYCMWVPREAVSTGYVRLYRLRPVDSTDACPQYAGKMGQFGTLGIVVNDHWRASLTPVDPLPSGDISTGPYKSNVGYGWRTFVFNAPVTSAAGAEIVE